MRVAPARHDRGQLDDGAPARVMSQGHVPGVSRGLWGHDPIAFATSRRAAPDGAIGIVSPEFGRMLPTLAGDTSPNASTVEDEARGVRVPSS